MRLRRRQKNTDWIREAPNRTIAIVLDVLAGDVPHRWSKEEQRVFLNEGSRRLRGGVPVLGNSNDWGNMTGRCPHWITGYPFPDSKLSTTP